MSLSLKIILGIAVFYVILGTVLGNLGLTIYDETESLTGLSGFDNYTVDTDIGLTEVTSFWQGLQFSLTAMPWYINVFLIAVLPISGTLAGIWLLRGNG